VACEERPELAQPGEEVGSGGPHSSTLCQWGWHQVPEPGSSLRVRQGNDNQGSQIKSGDQI